MNIFGKLFTVRRMLCNSPVKAGWFVTGLVCFSVHVFYFSLVFLLDLRDILLQVGLGSI